MDNSSRKQYLPESGQSIDVTTETRSAIPTGSPQIECDVEDASSVQQSYSVSEGDGEPAVNPSRGIGETTGALSATSLAETEEASATPSPPTDQVLPKFERKF